jgi:carboxypeptidase family protein
VRLVGRFKPASLVAALFTIVACHRGSQEDIGLLIGRCSERVRSKGPVPQVPTAPSLKSGYGGIVGTLADAGGALPHYSILASVPGDNLNSTHATAIADSAGGFTFDALPPGHYRLIVRAFSHRPDSAQVDVAAGRVDTVTLRPQFFDCVR